jgi:hypothetical protein
MAHASLEYLGAAMRSMLDFDPRQQCWVHDRLQNRVVAWSSGWADEFKSTASIRDQGPAVVRWDGFLLDGWWPWETWPPDGDL